MEGKQKTNQAGYERKPEDSAYRYVYTWFDRFSGCDHIWFVAGLTNKIWCIQKESDIRNETVVL